MFRNDISVLENHHSYTTFLILREAKTAILAHLPVAERKQIRSLIIQNILATDMSSHFSSIKKLATLKDLSSLNKEVEADRLLISQLTIHTSDLSGQTLPWCLAREWEDRISKEFAAQAKEEGELGIPTEPFMQNLDDLANRATLQMNFINFVLLPWYSQVARLIPGMVPFHAQLIANKERFANVAKAEAAKQQAAQNLAQENSA